MKIPRYVLALDQGTTSSRAIVFSSGGDIIASSQRAVTQHFPRAGWVEHDPMEILTTQLETAAEAVEKAGVAIDCVGIANQRETAVVWERATGVPVYNAVVWQCRRTAEYCEKLKSEGFDGLISSKTGLTTDAYFSAAKIKWILENIENGRERARNGELICGTVDSWLIYNLTGKRAHVTDVTNASRTMLFDIHNLKWDNELCGIFGIPVDMLPEVKDNAGIFGYIDAASAGLPETLGNLPISGVAGDQQAALFGQACFETGEVKNTYGTGCFTLMNIGSKPVIKTGGGLITTVGWKVGSETVYALEGSVFNAGSAIQWIRDNLGIIKTARECDILAESVPDNGGVHFVPAFTGLGSPYWDMYARGIISGITRGATRAHICRALLEGIAFQVCDLVAAMEVYCGCRISALRADGGASVSDFMMAFQADMLGVEVDRPEIVETTALGAAFFALLGAGLIKDKNELRGLRKTARLYKPSLENARRETAMAEWRKAVRRALSDS